MGCTRGWKDRIRIGKDIGIGRFPSYSQAINSTWLTASLIAATTLLAWPRLLALDGDLARAEPKGLRYRVLHTAGKLVHGDRRRPLKIPATWPWTERHRCRLDPDHHPAAGPPDQHAPSSNHGKSATRDPWNPGHPARQPGQRHARTIKSRSTKWLSHHPKPTIRPRE